MDLKYLVREPENITSKTTIMFMLHGYGSNEEDLFSFRETLPKDWIIVSYRAPRDTDFEGFSWYDINFMNPDEFIDIPQAEETLDALVESMMSITNHYGLTENETHLCGFSQGGILCYALAFRYPELFSKIACMSSYIEEKLINNKEISKDKKKIQNLRFFISHGTEDAVIPLEWARKSAEKMYDLGPYFSFREYMSGHGVNQKNYMDLMDFFAK